MNTLCFKRKWHSSGSNICSNDGIIIEIPVINPATGIEQMSSKESYKMVEFLTKALNDRLRLEMVIWNLWVYPTDQTSPTKIESDAMCFLGRAIDMIKSRDVYDQAHIDYAPTLANQAFITSMRKAAGK